MLWSGSTSLAVSLTSPIACSGQALTQALEPIYVWVSMTGWRVRSSATDLTVSALCKDQRQELALCGDRRERLGGFQALGPFTIDDNGDPIQP